MSESIEGGGRPAGERLRQIFEILEKDRPARSPQDALDIIQFAFRQVEAGEIRPMRVLPLRDMIAITVNERNIYYMPYQKHVLFLGDNGSIDIRVSEFSQGELEDNLKMNPNYAKENLEPAFSKPGDDGRGVWDN